MNFLKYNSNFEHFKLCKDVQTPCKGVQQVALRIPKSQKALLGSNNQQMAAFLHVSFHNTSPLLLLVDGGGPHSLFDTSLLGHGSSLKHASQLFSWRRPLM